MGLEYHSAPGCDFRPTKWKNTFQKHLDRKKWCPCQECGWTLEAATQGQQDGRTKSTLNQQNTTVITGNNNTVTNNIVNVNVSLPVFASGSEEERAYLKEHSREIIQTIVAGTNEPDAAILSRFVQETWCSQKHQKLNNVCALSSKGHEYLMLQMRGGRACLEYLAGRDAPDKLLDVASKTMHQMAVDSCNGYDVTRLWPPGKNHEPRDDANTVAWVGHTVSKAHGRKRDRDEVKRTIPVQLRDVSDRPSKKSKIKAGVADGDL